MKTLVLGASSNPLRYSCMAVKSLRQHNHEVIAIGTKLDKIDDVLILTDMPLITNIDTVTLYLNPQRQAAYLEYITQLKPRRVIFNPGTENPKLYNILKAENIQFEEACTLVLLATQQY